jgi:5-enolpyruvylshikimate-3-phosphate synthase
MPRLNYIVQGPQGCKLPGGDHRIAMTFTVAGLAAAANSVTRDAECAGCRFQLSMLN